MSVTQQVISIALIVIATILTRALPFILFPENRKPPAFISYLATVLPGAVIGMLVVYCLRDAVFSSWHCLPELIAILFIFLLHKWKGNTLLSIAGGTIVYMFLVQYVF